MRARAGPNAKGPYGEKNEKGTGGRKRTTDGIREVTRTSLRVINTSGASGPGRRRQRRVTTLLALPTRGTLEAKVREGKERQSEDLPGPSHPDDASRQLPDDRRREQ